MTGKPVPNPPPQPADPDPGVRQVRPVLEEHVRAADHPAVAGRLELGELRDRGPGELPERSQWIDNAAQGLPLAHASKHATEGVGAGERFHTLVLQPTTLCNLDCAYCYLPWRKANRLMPIEVAQACARSISDQNAPQPVDVVWHGGEPTATPLAQMRSLLAPFDQLRRAGLVRHGIQTNATMIDQRWCELFSELSFEVGVSVDGPAVANLHRVDWRGRSTWDRTMRGIDTLRDHGSSSP